MSDTNNRPKPDGSLRGDDGDLPNRGVGAPVPDSYGFSLEVNATNAYGKITAFTKSEAWDDNDAEDASEGQSGAGPARGVSPKGSRLNVGSDPVADRVPKEQQL